MKKRPVTRDDSSSSSSSNDNHDDDNNNNNNNMVVVVMMMMIEIQHMWKVIAKVMLIIMGVTGIISKSLR